MSTATLPGRRVELRATVRKYPYICPRAEWDVYLEQTPGRRLYWTMRSLAEAYLAVAKACPSVATGNALLRLAIIPDMHTVNFRPVAQRVIVSACTCCRPDAPQIAAAGGATFERLEDAPDGTQRWAWKCLRPGCSMTGVHDAERWAIEAAMLHFEGISHNATPPAAPTTNDRKAARP